MPTLGFASLLSFCKLFPVDFFPGIVVLVCFSLVCLNVSKVFGETWTAPITSISSEDIRGTVEQELASKEWDLKSKKKGKAKAKPNPTAETVALEDDDDAWSVPSSDDGAAGKPSAGKAPKVDKGERDAAVAARKLARTRAAAWKVQANQASRSIASLNSACASLKNVMAKAVKSSGLISDDLMASLKEASDSLLDFKDRASFNSSAIKFYFSVCFFLAMQLVQVPLQSSVPQSRTSLTKIRFLVKRLGKVSGSSC